MPELGSNPMILTRARVLALLLLCLAWSPALGQPAVPRPRASPSPRPSPSASPVAPAPSPSPSPSAGSPSPSPSPRHLTLEDALRTGLSTSPDLRQARAQVEYQRLNVDSVGVQMNPTLTTSASYTYQFQPVQETGSAFTRLLNRLIPGAFPSRRISPNLVSASATLQKLVTSFGRVQWETAAARLAVQQFRSQYRAQLEMDIQNIQVAYLEALLAEGQRDVARQVLTDQEALLENSRERAKAGLIAEYDVIQFVSTVANSQQNLEYAQANVEASHIALLSLIGLPVTEDLTLDPLPEPVPPPRSLREGLDRGLRLRPDLVALYWNVRAAEAEVEAAARGSYPYLTASSTYTGQSYFGENWSPYFVAGLELQVPVFDGGLARVQTDQAKVVVEEARASLEQTRRQVSQDVADAYVTLTSTWRRLAQAKVALDSASEALDIARLRFQAGLANAVEVLNVQSTYISAAGNLTDLRASYWIAEANWRWAISDEGDVAIPEGLRMDADLPPVPAPDPSQEIPKPGGPAPPLKEGVP